MTTGMLLICIFIGIFATALITAALARALTRGDNPAVVTAPRPQEWDPAVKSARRTGIIAFVAGFGAFVVLMLIPYPEGWLGAGLLAAPLLASAVMLVVYTVLPDARSQKRTTPGSTSSDDGLERPSLSRGYLGALVVAMVILLVVVVTAAMVAVADDMGRPGRALAFGSGSDAVTTGPFPGLFYGIPVLIGTVLLAVGTYMALRRNARKAALPGRKLVAGDTRWRVGSARIIVLAGLAVLLLEVAVVMFLMMSATRAGLASLSGSQTGHGWVTVMAQLVVVATFAAFACLAHLLYTALTLSQESAASLVAGRGAGSTS